MKNFTKKFLYIGMVNLAGLVFLFLLIEVGLRIMGYFYLKKALDKADNKKSENVVLCIGDSYTWNGNSIKDNYPYKLQMKCPNDYKIINGGRCEANSTEAYMRMVKLCEIYEPFCVIVLVGSANRFNPFGYNNFSQNKNSYLHNLRLYKLYRILKTNIKGEFLKRNARIHIKEQFRRIVLPENIFADVYETNKSGKNRYLSGEYLLSAKTDYKELENDWKEKIRLNPADSDIYEPLREYYKERGEYEKIEALYEKAIRLNPNKQWPYVDLIQYYFFLKEYKVVEEFCSNILVSHPGYYKVRIFLGALYMFQKRFSEAEEEFGKAIKLYSNNGSVYKEVGKAYAAFKKFNEAKEMFDKALELSNTDNAASIYRDLGYMLMVQGRYDSAFYYFLKAFEVSPEKYNYDNYYDVIKTYEFQSKYDSDYAYEKLKRLFLRKKIKDEMFTHFIEYFKNRANWEEKINLWLKQDLEKIVGFCIKQNIKLVIQNYPYPFASANRVLEEVAGKYSVPFVDNHSVFKSLVEKNGREKYFEESDHCTEIGHNVMTENIYNLLCEKGIISR